MIKEVILGAARVRPLNEFGTKKHLPVMSSKTQTFKKNVQELKELVRFD